MSARAQVLFNRTRGILHRHMPAAEIYHAAAHASMHGVQGCLLQIRCRCTHARSSDLARSISNEFIRESEVGNLACKVQGVKRWNRTASSVKGLDRIARIYKKLCKGSDSPVQSPHFTL